MVDIEERLFFAQGLKTAFKWAPARHLNSPIGVLGPQLLEYYSLLETQTYPEKVFQDHDVTRCSSFRIVKIPQNGRKKISLELLKTRQVTLIDARNNPSGISETIKKLPKMAQIWFDLFKSTMDKNPGHDPVLDKILRINENALCIELPVWTSTPIALDDGSIKHHPFQCNALHLFTGHIDLLMFDETDGSLVVADYKPENHFLKSLPQIAIYGLVVQRMFKNKKVKCVSFSRDKAWVYAPEIIQSVIPHYLQSNLCPEYEWQSIAFGLDRF